VELKDTPRARAPGDMVHKHSSGGALTRHKGARYRRRRSRPARLRGSLIAPRALSNMRGALRSQAKHPVSCDWMAPCNSTHVKRKREQKPRDPYPKSPSYSPVGKLCKTRRGQGRPGHQECAKCPVECAPPECSKRVRASGVGGCRQVNWVAGATALLTGDTTNSTSGPT
jgi:hypothetical protein